MAPMILTRSKLSAPRIMAAVLLALFGFWYIAAGVRWLTAIAWPDGKLVLITEDTTDTTAALARLFFGIAFAIAVPAIALLVKLTPRGRSVLLACLLVPPLVLAMILGQACEADRNAAAFIHCSGNLAVFKLTMWTGISGVIGLLSVILFLKLESRS
jgi:hypothetical protein